MDSLDEQRSMRLRQRLWGAAVLIAILVIVLPLLLDGSGSESQYRRVESLRAEPPRVLDKAGIPEPVEIVQDASSGINLGPFKVGQSAIQQTNDEPAIAAGSSRKAAADASATTEVLTAWVVQAGSFGEEANAIAVRNKLRRAGFPSFVTPTEGAPRLYRVRVGPMINLDQAEASRDDVMRLLNREAIVVSYP